DLGQLAEHVGHISESLKKARGAVDVDNTFVVGKPQLRVSIERDRAADLGVQVSDVAETLQLFVGGLKASSYAERGEEYDIRVRADARFRASPESLALMTVPSRRLGSVPLSSVITTQAGTGPAEIHRLGRRREITITANS